MTVTNYNKKKNPAKDAIRIVDAMIGGSSRWKNIYLGIVSHYNGDKPYLDKALEAVAVSRGVSPFEINDRLGKLFEESEKERKSLGSKLLVSGSEEGSAVEQNTSKGYRTFLKTHAKSTGVALNDGIGSNGFDYETVVRDEETGEILKTATEDEVAASKEALFCQRSEDQIEASFGGFFDKGLDALSSDPGYDIRK